MNKTEWTFKVGDIPLLTENSSVAARELPSAGGGISYQAAAPGIGLLRHAQLRHAAEGVLAQAVAQSTRQVLQVCSTPSAPFKKGSLVGGTFAGFVAQKNVSTDQHQRLLKGSLSHNNNALRVSSNSCKSYFIFIRAELYVSSTKASIATDLLEMFILI